MQDFKRINYDVKINGQIEKSYILHIKSMQKGDIYQIIPIKVVFTKITNTNGRKQLPLTLLAFENLSDFYKVYQFKPYVRDNETMIVGRKIARELSLKTGSTAKISLGHQSFSLSVLGIFPRSSYFDEIVVTDSINLNNRLNELKVGFSSLIINKVI